MTNLTRPVESAESPTGRFFTVETANRALSLVRPITADIVKQYAELMRSRTRFQTLSLENAHDDELEALNDQIDAATERLNGLIDELHDVGAQLKDPRTGLIDFPALHEGRIVLLCWKVDEERLAYWHELETGFGGRQPITADFVAAG
ncbi:MAG: DUF2203 domain-containing protein [Phycisphaerales bacterium]|nr:DUF2203 domain-containing protein [Phycisphaerales bacterium]